MSTYSDRTNAILSRLQDLARDLESHTGLASRSHEANPAFSRANHFPQSAYQRNDREQESIERTRAANVAKFVSEYRAQAGRATIAVRDIEFPGVELTSSDKQARDAVHTLVAAINTVETHEDAVALVASLGGN